MTAFTRQDIFLMARLQRRLFVVGLFSVAMNILLLTVPLFSFQTFDRVLTSRSEDTLGYLVLISVAALMVLAGLDALRSQILGRLGAWTETALSHQILSGARSSADGRDLAVKHLRDVASVRAFLASPIFAALLDSPLAPLYLVIVFLIHPTLGWLTLAGGFVLCGLAALNLAITRGPLEASHASSTSALSRVQESLQSNDAIVSMGMKASVANRWHRANSKILAEYLQVLDRLNLISATSKFARLLFQIVVMGAGTLLVMSHEISAGAMIAASLITARALAPIDATISSWITIAQARDAWRRVRRLTCNEKGEFALSLPRPTGLLVVEQVSFAPAESRKPILSEISFRIQPGETLAVVGPTAAGKTTLLRLLIGILPPSSGCVRLDGADVYAWQESGLGKHVGYLPHDVQLLPGTVAENISRLDNGSSESVILAARKAGVHEMILRLPDGYRTDVGGTGVKLSSGQRQRLGLARALFQSPAFLVLDEPNSNLDAPGESALVLAMDEAKRAGTTIVVVTHRPNLLQRVDKILLLRDGRCQAFGPRDEILGRGFRLAQQSAETSSTTILSGHA